VRRASVKRPRLGYNQGVDLFGMTGDALEQWARSRGASAGGARGLARFLLARAAGRPLPEPPARALLA